MPGRRLALAITTGIGLIAGALETLIPGIVPHGLALGISLAAILAFGGLFAFGP